MDTSSKTIMRADDWRDQRIADLAGRCNGLEETVIRLRETLDGKAPPTLLFDCTQAGAAALVRNDALRLGWKVADATQTVTEHAFGICATLCWADGRELSQVVPRGTVLRRLKPRVTRKGVLA